MWHESKSRNIHASRVPQQITRPSGLSVHKPSYSLFAISYLVLVMWHESKNKNIHASRVPQQINRHSGNIHYSASSACVIPPSANRCSLLQTLLLCPLKKILYIIYENSAPFLFKKSLSSRAIQLAFSSKLAEYLCQNGLAKFSKPKMSKYLKALVKLYFFH